MWNYRCSAGALCHTFTFFVEAEADVDLYFKRYLTSAMSGWKWYNFSWHNEPLLLA